LAHGPTLHQETLLNICCDHNSEILIHHGNEFKQGKSSMNPNIDETSQSLNPKNCSKIVTIFLQDADAKHGKLACMHQWNIPTQLELKMLSNNSSVVLNFNADALLFTGEVNTENPLERGKFVVVIKKGVSNISFSVYPIDGC